MIRILAILQTAFSLWMLVDAIRRRCSSYWWIVIMVPFGEWVYFFTVKIYDPEFRPFREALQALFRKKASLEELRFRQEQTPCFENTLMLAQTLYDAGQYQEAAEFFEYCLRQEESDEVLFGLAMCRMGRKRFEEAAELLQKLVERKPDHQDYEAWSQLALALTETGRRAEAVEWLERLVALSSRLNHRMLLAHYLSCNGQGSRARDQLETGLNEYRHAPRFLKKSQRAWARQAKQMLSKVQAQPV